MHAGFSGLLIIVARKKGHCNLIRNRLVIPHDTIPSTLWASLKTMTSIKTYKWKPETTQKNGAAPKALRVGNLKE